MVIAPKVRGFICTTAHPTGCKAHVEAEIEYVKKHLGTFNGPKKVLVIGASTGYGLSSRIVAAFGGHAATIGVSFERPAADNRTATAGWYNTAAFEALAHEQGLYAKSINGDAYSDEIKQQTIELIRKDWQGGVDCVIYSLASPRRINPRTGETLNSVLKPIGKSFSGKTINIMSGELSTVTIEPANEEEIRHTVAVMGGEDWQWWMEALKEAGLLAKDVKTVAYSYIGPELTFPIYYQGTIGRAKADLEQTAARLTKMLQHDGNGAAYISVNKGLVTQASAAIPVVPLYISLLYHVMKEKGSHEGCIEQIARLFKDRLYCGKAVPVDEGGRIRIDDWEMAPEVQREIAARWQKVDADLLAQYADLEGYREEFYKLFGFNWPGVDYAADVSVDVAIPSIE
jgi:enoyl-[acyl-carrier protein] reductase / trans-2-enoyl-CoA reductase (NAD+)